MESTLLAPLLPTELWLITLDALKEGARPRLGTRDPGFSARRKALASLTKVSRYFRGLVEETLYQDISFKSNNYKKAALRLVEALGTHPERLPKINAVRLDGWDLLFEEARNPPKLLGPHVKGIPLATRVLDSVFRMSSLSTVQLSRTTLPASLLAYLLKLPTLDTIHCTTIQILLPWPADFTSDQVRATDITLRSFDPGNISAPSVRQAHRLLEHELKRLVYAGSFTSDLSDFINERSPEQPCFGPLEENLIGATLLQASLGLVSPHGPSPFPSSFNVFRAIADQSSRLVSAHFASAEPQFGTTEFTAGAFPSLQRLSAPSWLAARILPQRTIKHVTILGLGDSTRFGTGPLSTGITSVATLNLQADSWDAFCLDKIHECFPSLELIELHLRFQHESGVRA